MGEYAQMSIERDLDNFFYEMDSCYENDCDCESVFPYKSNKTETKTLFGKNILPYKEFERGTLILLRRENGSLNRVCKIVKKTEKAVLFKIDNDFEDDINGDYLFWMPKSVIFMLEGELKVYYLKSWAIIKKVN